MEMLSYTEHRLIYMLAQGCSREQLEQIYRESLFPDDPKLGSGLLRSHLACIRWALGARTDQEIVTQAEQLGLDNVELLEAHHKDLLAALTPLIAPERG